MNNEVFLVLEKDKNLTSLESDFIEKLNRTLDMLNDKQAYENFINKISKAGPYAFIDRNNFGDFRDIIYYFTKINIACESASLVNFDSNISVYPVYKINEVNLMPINAFMRFIKEQDISTIFVSNFADINIVQSISEADIQDFYDERLFVLRKEVYDLYKRIIVPQVNIFNSILAKLSTKSSAGQMYMCFYNGVQITSREASTNSLDTNLILKLIYFSNLEEFTNNIQQVKKNIEENEKIEQKEYEMRKAKKLIQLEEQIKNDPKFRKITQARMRERYLRDVLRNEDDEVISYFDMKRRYDGSLMARSLAGQEFINKIWEELNKN